MIYGFKRSLWLHENGFRGGDSDGSRRYLGSCCGSIEGGWQRKRSNSNGDKWLVSFFFLVLNFIFQLEWKWIVSEWIWVVEQQELRETSCEASETDTHPPFSLHIAWLRFKLGRTAGPQDGWSRLGGHQDWPPHKHSCCGKNCWDAALRKRRNGCCVSKIQYISPTYMPSL